MGNLNKNLSSVSDEDMKGGNGWKVKPDGYYRVTLAKAEVGKPNEKGTIQMFAKYVHLDPRFAGKEDHDYITVSCPTSPKAQSIGEAHLKMLAISVGHPNPNEVNDSNELMTNRPFMIRLWARPRKERDNDKRVDVDGKVQEIGDRISEAEFSSLPLDRAVRPGMAVGTAPPASNGTDQAAYDPAPPIDDNIPF